MNQEKLNIYVDSFVDIVSGPVDPKHTYNTYTTPTYILLLLLKNKTLLLPAFFSFLHSSDSDVVHIIEQTEYDDIVINYLTVRGIPVTPPREV